MAQQITVNARTYDLVPLDEVTLDEAIVVWEYAKLSLDQIPDLEGFHPGVIAALIHIAIARVENEPAKTIRQVVGKIKVSELEKIFEDISEEVEQLPPPEEHGYNSSGSSGSGETSSTIGEPGLEHIARNGSGNPGSAIGAISDQETSVR